MINNLILYIVGYYEFVYIIIIRIGFFVAIASPSTQASASMNGFARRPAFSRRLGGSNSVSSACS